MGRGLSPALLLGPALIILFSVSLRPIECNGNVGCLFSASLCIDQTEWCYDDHAFGKCLNIYGDVREEDYLRHELTNDELRAFERELQRLLLLGYRWSHMYTQCILQAMLHSIKNKLPYEPSACDNLSDQDLTAALGALETGSTEMDPNEVAFVRFTPNSDSEAELDSSNFADEVYFPPGDEYIDDMPNQPSMTLDEEEIPSEYDTWQNTIKRLQKRSKGHVFSRIYNTPGDFRQGHETKDLTMEDLENIINNEYIPKGDVGTFSNNNDDELLTSQDMIYLLKAENENQLKNILLQFNDADEMNYPMNNYKDPINKWLQAQDVEQLKTTLAKLKEPYNTNIDPYYLATSDYLTKNRLHSLDKFNHEYNTPDNFRQGFETKDILLDENPDAETEMIEPRIYIDEENDGDNLREESGSGEQDQIDKLRELEYLTNNRITHNGYTVSSEADRMPINNDDSALLSRLLNIWRSEASIPNSGSAPVYTEGGMVYLPDRTESKGHTDNNQLLDRSLGALLADYEWGFKRKERLDVKKPGPPFDTHNIHFNHDIEINTNNTKGINPQMVKKDDSTDDVNIATGGSQKDVFQDIHKSSDIYDVDISYVYVGLKNSIRTWEEGVKILQTICELLHLEPTAFSYPRVDRNEVTFKVEENSKSWNASEVAIRIDGIKDDLKKKLGVEITSAGLGDKTKYPAVLQLKSVRGEWIDWDNWNETGTLWAALVAGTVAATVAASALFLLARHHQRRKDKLRDLASGDTEASQDYQALCRARMSGKWQTGGGNVGGSEKEGGQRIASLSKDSDGNSPSTRSSTSSWSEEPALTNMDISTGHMVLTYMEDHLKNKDRLEQEWRALCAYEAEPCSTRAAEAPENISKNRNPGVLPYDHSRLVLNDVTNIYNSDYINASTITDHDPRNPAYIAAQGPLAETAADWWQMVWEQGSVVLVMLTRLSEGSVLCHRYWPEEGSQLYHIYEVHLVSEHIWCDDYLVRSFYLKNLKTGETRTVTQFHFLSWPDRGVPSSTKALLEFRRKVNKSYRGRSCPIVVHCSDGAGRTGTYCLIDMVLNRMAKGAKEIDIAATLEHIRDQRPHMVTTKQQFEFVLMAVAEEVHAILKALPAQLQQQHEKREKELAAEKEKQDKEKDK